MNTRKRKWLWKNEKVGEAGKPRCWEMVKTAKYEKKGGKKKMWLDKRQSCTII